MKRWLLMVLPLGLFLAWSPLAHGNGAPPFRPKQGFPVFAAKEVKLSVEVDKKAKQARLIVPMNLMMGGFWGPGLGGPGIPGAGGVPGGGGAGADARPLGVPTLFAGLALTMALATGGLWLVKRPSGRLVAGAVILGALTLGATTLLWADLAPFPRPQPVPQIKTTPVALPAGIQLNGRILIEMGPHGNAVRLIVPSNAVLPRGEAKAQEQAPASR
jgi:hypothetical protein